MSGWAGTSRIVGSVLAAMALTTVVYRTLSGESWMRASLFAALTILLTIIIVRLWLGRRRTGSGRGTASTDVRCSVEVSLEEPLPAATALDCGNQALRQLDRINPSSVKVSPRHQAVTGRTRRTRRSWGERVAVRYVLDGDGLVVAARLSSEPVLPTTLFDGGENRKNVDALERWYRVARRSE